MRWVFVAVLAALAWVFRTVGGEVVDDPSGSALLALGCLLVGGLFAGELAARLRLPRVTGYLVLGMLGGPSVTGLATTGDLGALHLFEELALGLIALTAGGEFRLRGGRLGTVVAISATHLLVIPAVVGGVVVGILLIWPVLGPLHPGEIVAAAALLGVIAAAKSPATTIAVITELRARGSLVDTVLGVTVLKDLLILLVFTSVYSLAQSWAVATPVSLAALHDVGVEILASLAVGAVLGALLGTYLRAVGRHAELAVLLLALVATQIGPLEHLLVCMAAGVTVRNLFPREASQFLEALERSSPPVYVVFFGLVGAGLALGSLARLWLAALVYALVRLGAIWLATGAPAALSRAPRPVVRDGWMGFVAQAGLSLGLAARVARDLPGFGREVATLVVAAVVLNQLIGPVLWAWALRRNGEARE